MIIGAARYSSAKHDDLDDKPANDVRLGTPCGVAVSGGSSVFVCAYGENAVFRVDGKGILHVAAGGGRRDGDGVPAARAYLSGPTSIAVDGRGNLLLVDEDCDVRRVDRRGRIWTVARGGKGRLSGRAAAP